MKPGKVILSLIFLSWSLALLPNSVSATQYYVDNVSGNDGNSGTSTSAAWKTIARVNSKMSQLVAGDIVSFKRGGTWTDLLTISKSGISGNPITFNAYGTGNKPIIRYPGTDSARIILITGNYIVIDGLKVIDGYYRGIDIKANYTVVKNCEFTNVGTGVDVQGDHNLISKNYFHDLIMTTNDSAPNNDLGVVGVCLKDTDNEVSYNTMVDLREPCVDYGWAGRCVDFFGQTSRCYVHHNYSYRCQGFLEVGASSIVTVSDVRVEYNVTLDAGRFTGINNSPGDYQVTLNNFKVQNNTIVETANSPVTTRDAALVFDAAGTSGQYIFRNNILYFDGWNRVVSNWTTFTHDHNLFYLINGTQLNITKHSTEITGSDPQFVSLSTKDLHLKSGSPARDKGVDLGYSGTVDFDGNAVPSGSAPDIGAYEYVSSGAALSANASASPTSGQAPLAVSFTGSASGGASPYTYSWAFGDGGSSTSQNPSHTYQSAGTRTATLTAKDSASATASKSVTITVSAAPSPLTANASASPTSGQAPLAVSFTGSATGGTSPYTYSWAFGDGGSSTSQNPSHVYSSDGNYTATLTVTDLNFANAGATVNITVADASTTANLSLSAQTGAPAPGVGGTTNPSPGNHSYSIGATISVKSIANTDYRFSKWTGDIEESSLFSSTSALTMDNDRSLSATFCTKCSDVNGDLKITPADAQAAFDIYLKRISSPTWCELENADVNSSGTKLAPRVTPADAQAIFHKYLKKGGGSGDCSGNSRTAATSTQTAGPINAKLTIDNMAYTPGLDILVPIIIESPSEIAAFGFDLAFPSDALTFIGLETTELTKSYSLLDASVIAPAQPTDQAQADAGREGTLVLRVGGYKADPDQLPSLGVLVVLIFKPTGQFIDPNATSIIAKYDDLQNASIINRMISSQDHSQTRENKRDGKNVAKGLPDKRSDF